MKPYWLKGWVAAFVFWAIGISADQTRAQVRPNVTASGEQITSGGARWTSGTVAQDSGTTGRLTASRIMPGTGDSEPSGYLVEYTTSEPDTSNGMIITCAASPSPGVYDSCTPRKTVTHYEPFSTAKAAIDWVNCWEGTCAMARQDATGVWIASPAFTVYPKKFIRLLAVHPVSVSESKTTREIPQPAKTETKTEYRLKEQK